MFRIRLRDLAFPDDGGVGRDSNVVQLLSTFRRFNVDARFLGVFVGVVGKSLRCLLLGTQDELRCLIRIKILIIGLHHPLDGVTSPEYKLLRCIQLTNFLQREEGTSFKLGYVLPSSALFIVDILPL